MNRRYVSLASAGATLLGATLLCAGFVLDARRACFAYLAAWTTGVTLCIGALLLLMTGHASKARWMLVTRRLTEAVIGTLPLYLALFIPICVGMPKLYPWVLQPDEHKKVYLNAPFFEARSAVYFAVFIAIGTLLRRWSRDNDARPSMKLVLRMRRLSGGGLPLVALVTTWASFDWVMSLQPEWYSTIFGLYFFAGAFCGAIALVSLFAHLSQSRAHRPSRVTPDHAQALGRLLFAMIAFWAYMAFSQLLIYWIADIPAEITFYGRRTTGSWSVVTSILVVGNFVVPFFALLNRSWKRNTSYLGAVACWVLAMHFVDIYWLVLPVCDRAGVRPHWVDAGALLLFGGLSCATIVRLYLSAPALPTHDPGLAEGLGYEAAV